MDWHLPLVSLTSLKGARLALGHVIEHALSLASATPLQTPRHQRLRFATYPPVSTTLWEGRRLLETRTPARRGGQGVSRSGLARAGSIPPLPNPCIAARRKDSAPPGHEDHPCPIGVDAFAMRLDSDENVHLGEYSTMISIACVGGLVAWQNCP